MISLSLSLTQQDEDTLRHCTCLYGIPRTKDPGGLSPQGHKESDMTERLTQMHTHMVCNSKKYEF